MGLWLIPLVAAPAAAAPVAELRADVDGSGGETRIALDGDGTLHVGAATVALGKRADHATLQAARSAGVPTVVVEAGDEAVVVQQAGGAWKAVARAAVGGVGADREYAIEVAPLAFGVVRYQTRPGWQRCDGKPALLYAEGFDGAKFRRLARLPTMVADGAPVVTARVDGEPAARPALFFARAASHEWDANDAGALAIPFELDDGKPDTTWHEGFAASDGEGQFFTFAPRVARAKAAQLRVVAAGKQFNRLRRVAVVWAGGAVHVDLPDAAGEPAGSALVADLPATVAGCVSVVIEQTWGPASGTTAIAELEVFADGERAGGGDAMLAATVARGDPGEAAAVRELARRGAAGVAAIDGELGKAADPAARRRLVRALVEGRDAAAGPVLARAVQQGWVADRELVAVIDALGALGQAAVLRELAGKTEVALDARVAAVGALKDVKLLVELAGVGPNALRKATIDALAAQPAAIVVGAAQAADGRAAGDLWRAATRRARSHDDERDATVTAMAAALPAATDYERRYRLVDGLATLGDAPAIATLTEYLRALTAGAVASALRQVAARAIGDRARPEATALVLALARDDDPGVRLAALGALAGAESGVAGAWHGAEGPAEIDRAIGSALATDRWPEVRRRAAQVLGGRCARPEPAKALEAAFGRDPELEVRGDALAALVECKAPGVGELLVRTWGTAKQPIALRRRAIDLAVALGDRAIGGKLVGELARWRGAALESAEALALAQDAAYAIGRLAPIGGVEALEAALEDGAFPEIVAAAASGLGLMGPACPARAKAKLKALARDGEQQVATAAAHAAALCGK